MAVRTDLDVYRCQSKVYRFRDTTGSGSIAGWTLAFTVRKTTEATGAVVFTRTTANGGIVITDAAAREFEVSIPASVSNVLPRDYAYDVWRTDTDSEDLLAIGKFTVLRQVRVAKT